MSEKNYYVLPIIGTGTRDDPYRPELPSKIAILSDGTKIDELAVSWSGLIPSDPATGKPLHNVALVKAKGSSVQHDAIRNMMHREIDLDVDVHASTPEVDALKKQTFQRIKSKGKQTKFTKPLELDDEDASNLGRVLDSRIPKDWMKDFDVT